jgi:hypothetical protein
VYLRFQTMSGPNFYNHLWRRYNLLKFRSAMAITEPVILRRSISNALAQKRRSSRLSLKTEPDEDGFDLGSNNVKAAI